MDTQPTEDSPLMGDEPRRLEFDASSSMQRNGELLASASTHNGSEDEDEFDVNKSMWHMSQSSLSRDNSSRTDSFRSRFGDSIRSTSSLPARWIHSITISDRREALQLPGIGPAAFLIRDAVTGEEDFTYEDWYDPYRNPENEWRNFFSILARRISGNWWTVHGIQAAAWIATLVTFVEEPFWCHYMARDHDQYDSCAEILAARGDSVDGLTDVPYYPNAHSAFLSSETSRLIELICACIISFSLLLRFAKAGFCPRRFFMKGSQRGTRWLQTIMLLMIFRGLISGYTGFTPIVRIMMLGSFLKDFQKELATMIRMLPQILDILALLAVLIVFWGWAGVVLFYGTEQGQHDFSNIIEACWTLYQCVTTVNYPDIMMLSYNKNHFAALYFVFFMIVSFFFLMNLILASVTNSYQKSIDERQVWRGQLAEKNLKKAFELLDSEEKGHIGRDSIMAVFCVLNEDFTEFRRLGKEETKMLFGFLDKDGDSVISAEEFQNFGHVLLLRFTRVSAYETFVQVHFPRTFRSEWYQYFCNIVKSQGFEQMIEVVLVLNAIIVAIQSYPELAGEEYEKIPEYSNGQIDTYWEMIETFFTIVYVIEVFIKITVYGWRRYRESSRNKFDLCVTIMVVAVTLYVYSPNDFNDTRLIRFFLMARVLRLIRLLATVKQFQLIGSISANILAAASNVVLFLFFLMYCFAVAGMIKYGGMITRDPNNPFTYKLLNTKFSDNEYWANNFNDMFSGMNVLFNLLVVNNWTECELGFEAATGAKWVRWFFLSFHVLGVILVSNLLVAFTINAIFQQLETIKPQKEPRVVDSHAIIEGSFARFDASEITGTKTDASGEYIASIRAIHKDIKLNEHQGLVNLF